jgi:formyl-CoA transferase
LKPLSGVVVLDVSRMLPGAVLAWRLLALGARVLKVEDPAGGDPMRSTPPFLNGTGAGFATFLAGAESVALDLQEPATRGRSRRSPGTSTSSWRASAPGRSTAGGSVSRISAA